MEPLTPREKLAAARQRIGNVTPYFTGTVSFLVPHEDMSIPTMGVSRDCVLYFNSQWVSEQTVAALAFSLVHECLHLLDKHADRLEPLYPDDHELRNHGADLAINPAVKKLGYPAPKKILWPAQYKMPDGNTAEWYCEQLLKNKDWRQQIKLVPGGGHCGSCATHSLPNESEVGRTKAEIDRMRKDTAAAIKDAAGRGSVPGDLLRWAEGELTPPKVRWQDVLARAIRRGYGSRPGFAEYTYQKPSRRQWCLGRGALIQSHYQPIPNVLSVVDSSGSMGPDELRSAVSEVVAVLRSVGAPVWIGSCDADLNGEPKQVWDVAQIQIRGGGGTDFAPPFVWLAKRRNRGPSLVIYLTDGDGAAPAACPPGVDVVWVLVGKHARKPDFAGEPFGSFVFTDQ